MKRELRSQEQIDSMRKRLYDRSGVEGGQIRHRLTDTQVDVRRDWVRSEPVEPATTDLRAGLEVTVNDPLVIDKALARKSRRRYRAFVLIGSLFIFISVAVVSSLFLYFGGNQISSANIDVVVVGPASIGGGEVISAQIGVTNQNTVPITGVTLIVKYPPGTRTIGEDQRNLYEERIPLPDISPGEVRNESVKLAVFGEENDEKSITATLEYRIEGSSGTFYKDSEPMTFRISSSPLVLRVESIEKVSSGQLVDITLTAVSNASSPLYDVLVSAEFPNGFTFENSEPEPVFGQNVWRIDKLLPEESVTIKVQGIVNGLNEETFRVNFSAGPADVNNAYIVGATLADARTEFTIERPFIDIDIDINGTTNGVAIISEAQSAEVVVDITNTLDETVYDMVVEVIPEGNALDERSIRSNQGFYDSNNEKVRWEVSNNSSFSQVLPGDSRSLQFVVVPSAIRTTASFNMIVNVYARRVSESSAQETLIGTVVAEAKYSSTVTVGSQSSRNDQSFSDTGPIPPKVGETTTYTITLVAQAGANDVTSAVVNTSLPLYVNWLDAYEGDGAVTYNSISKQLQWVIGDIPSGQQQELTFQVSMQPSTSQIGTSPTLLNTQSVRANDRFTGQLLQESAPAVTTELSTEMGFAEENGKVIR